MNCMNNFKNASVEFNIFRFDFIVNCKNTNSYGKKEIKLGEI